MDWEHMLEHVKSVAKELELHDTLKAADYAVKAHDGQKRKRSETPYIWHPLSIACHALAMNIYDDEIIAACMLHDVAEDCGRSPDELPVGEEARELVRLLTREKTDDDKRESVLKRYYGDIAGNPKASLIKCLDRCNNLTTMCRGLSFDRRKRMIAETERYYPKLLDVLKGVPEYYNASWLLEYQIWSMLDIIKVLGTDVDGKGNRI